MSGSIPDLDHNNQPELNKFQQDISAKWPLGIIKYFVNITCYDFIVGHRIRMTMNMLETVSCLKFTPVLLKPEYSNDWDSSWLHITNPKNERLCSHSPIINNKEIVLVLGLECLSNTQILHSLLHALGFVDEVTHPNRDQYIRVLWQNIQPAYRYLYNINTDQKSALVMEYDPLSVMHFNDHDFGINGQATIEPVASGLSINPSDELSQLDMLKLNMYFGHICQRRDADKILNACKNTLNKNTGMDTKGSNEYYKDNEDNGEDIKTVQALYKKVKDKKNKAVDYTDEDEYEEDENDYNDNDGDEYEEDENDYGEDGDEYCDGDCEEECDGDSCEEYAEDYDEDKNKDYDKDGDEDNHEDNDKDYDIDGDEDNHEDNDKDYDIDGDEDNHEDNDKDYYKDGDEDYHEDNDKDYDKDGDEDNHEDNDKDYDKDRDEDNHEDNDKDYDKDGDEDNHEDNDKDYDKDGSEDNYEDNDKDYDKDGDEDTHVGNNCDLFQNCFNDLNICCGKNLHENKIIR